MGQFILTSTAVWKQTRAQQEGQLSQKADTIGQGKDMVSGVSDSNKDGGKQTDVR